MFQYLGGPWKSGGHRTLFKGAGQEMRANFDHKFSLYRAIYPRMVTWIFKGKVPMNFGTEAHMEDFWYDYVCESSIITGADTSYESNRWACWSQSWDVYDSELDVIVQAYG